MSLRALILAALLAPASAVVIAQNDGQNGKDDVDRYGMVQVKPTGAYVASAALVTAATGMQMVTHRWASGVLGDAVQGGVGKAVLGCVDFLQNSRKNNPLAMVLAHGVVSKACADVLAQTIPQGGLAKAWIDPLRLFRSMLASVLSTSIPFYYWTKLMAMIFKDYKAWLAKGPLPGLVSKALTSTFGTAAVKTIVTQATFRPVNVLGFLALQSIFRGDSIRQLSSFLTSKARSSVIGGIAFYSVSNLFMYSVPVPFLHPIMGSIAGLIFNVWLAIVAYRK